MRARALLGQLALVLAGAIWFLHRRKKQVLAKPKKQAIIKWSSDLECYCRTSIFLDLLATVPCKETIGAIFAVPPELFDIRTAKGEVIETNAEGVLALQPDKEYMLALTEAGEERVADELRCGQRIKIKELASEFCKVGAINDLSAAFYKGVWQDTDTNFRKLFTGKTSMVSAIHNQSTWLEEMWGGAKQYTAEHGEGSLVKVMLSKHPTAILSLHNALQWVHHMNDAMHKVVHDEALEHSLRLYWGHFFGFFAFTPTERTTLMEQIMLTKRSRY